MDEETRQNIVRHFSNQISSDIDTFMEYDDPQEYFSSYNAYKFDEYEENYIIINRWFIKTENGRNLYLYDPSQDILIDLGKNQENIAFNSIVNIIDCFLRELDDQEYFDNRDNEIHLFCIDNLGLRFNRVTKK